MWGAYRSQRSFMSVLLHCLCALYLFSPTKCVIKENSLFIIKSSNSKLIYFKVHLWSALEPYDHQLVHLFSLCLVVSYNGFPFIVSDQKTPLKTTSGQFKNNPFSCLGSVIIGKVHSLIKYQKYLRNDTFLSCTGTIQSRGCLPTQFFTLVTLYSVRLELRALHV